MTDILIALGTIVYVLGTIAFSFFVNTGLVWVACWAFGWTFTWKLAIGIYVVEVILKSIFKIVLKKG